MTRRRALTAVGRQQQNPHTEPVRKDSPMRKTTGAFVATIMVASLAACSSETDDTNGTTDSSEQADADPGEATTLQMAALEGGYGTQLYYDAIEAFEELNPGVEIELTISRSIEDEITPNMQAGRFPDVVVLGQGRAAALTETLIRDQALEELTDVLSMTVPGEDVTVGDKLTDGIAGSLGTNPYGDDRTFLMPLNYSPTGLVYDQGLFDEMGWDLPTAQDEFFELGDTAAAEDIALFTYPTAGYLDSYFNALLATVGGTDFFRDVMTYQEGVWTTPEATQAIDLTTRLLQEYTADTTVGYANEQDFTLNQQSILDRTAVFMPNGTWIAGEMADAPRPDTFSWGLMPMPALQAGDDRYITTSIETAWVPAGAENKDLAKEFIAFLYSDTAVEIFAESNAIQPVQGVTALLPEELVGFYQVYDTPGVQALVGGFASTAPVEGVSIQQTLYDSANSVATGDKTAEQWLADLDAASERLHAASE
jgi:N-acetylglucosamine transport system substrate-binding protein